MISYLLFSSPSPSVSFKEGRSPWRPLGFPQNDGWCCLWQKPKEKDLISLHEETYRQTFFGVEGFPHWYGNKICWVKKWGCLREKEMAAPIRCRTLEKQMFKSDTQCNSLFHIHKSFRNSCHYSSVLLENHSGLCFLQVEVMYTAGARVCPRRHSCIWFTNKLMILGLDTLQ